MNIHLMWAVDHITPSIDVHEHNFYQVIYCKSGNGRIFCGGKWHDAVAGNIYFANLMEKHAIEPNGDMRLIEVKFTVDDENVRKLLKSIPSVFSFNTDPRMNRLFEDFLEECFCREAYSSDTSTALFSILLIKLLRKYVLVGKDDEFLEENCGFPLWSVTRFVHGDDKRIRHIIEYIEQHLAEEITLDSLAECLHFNKSYLGVLFKNIYGISLKKYVSQLRMERAKELLLTTDNSITYIAKKTGFKSIHYFSYVFKRVENMSPQEYRMMYKG